MYCDKIMIVIRLRIIILQEYSIMKMFCIIMGMA